MRSDFCLYGRLPSSSRSPFLGDSFYSITCYGIWVLINLTIFPGRIQKLQIKHLNLNLREAMERIRGGDQEVESG
jgi:hypothetical protein